MHLFENEYGGYSSAGRAPDCGSGCRGFEPHYPPHTVAEGRGVRSGPGHTSTLGCSQVVRHGTLTPAFAGSSPAIPATASGQSPLGTASACGESGTRSLVFPLPIRPKGGFMGIHEAQGPVPHTSWACPVRVGRQMQFDPVAQLVEQRPFKAKVRGSSPRWVTTAI